MSNNGPSAEQVAAAYRMQQIEAEMRVLQPDRYKEYRSAKLGEGLLAFGSLVGSFAIGAKMGVDAASFFPFVLVFGIGIVIFAWLMTKGRAAQMRARFETKRILEEHKSKKMVKEINQRISDDEAMRIGDTIIAHEGATIVNKSIIVNSFNSLNERNPELAQALKQLAGYVEASGDKNAGEAFDNLVEAVDNSEKPSVIRAFWNDLVNIMPDVEKVGTAAVAITKLFL